MFDATMMTASRHALPFGDLATAPELPAVPTAANEGDYARVRQVLALMSEDWRSQPGVEEIAARAGLGLDELHALFRRWCGLTPKAFLQAITLDHARALLKDSASVLDTAYEVGFSGPGRLHDLFVTHEAMSPGEYKSGGEGLTLSYGFHGTPFGEALLVMTPRGVAGLGWVSTAQDGGKAIGGRAEAFADMQRRWPRARFVLDQAATGPQVARIFDPAQWQDGQPLRVVLIGTDFEVRVWETLLKLPLGKATTYGTIARSIGKPKAARAIGAAVGRNPISFVVPCHRVIGQSGALTGYHWGLTRKRAILGWEAAQIGAA